MVLVPKGQFQRGRTSMSRQKRGFTLIEIAVVLIVVGILLAGGLAGIKPAMESSRISATNKKLDRIELALLAYAIQNGCLPCPANGTLGSTDTSGNAGWSYNSTPKYYGPNDTAASALNQPCSGASCKSTAGVVPWNTLDLKDGDTVDAWQNRITYAVTSTLTVTAGSSMARTTANTYPAGTLAVYNNSGVGGSSTCDTGVAQTTAAAYVLVSHGSDRVYGYAAKNGAQVSTGANSSSTAQECNDPAAAEKTPTYTFHQDLPRPTEGATYFDDIVRFRTAPGIVQDCGKNACGNPP